MEPILVLGAGLLGTRVIGEASGKYEVHAADSDVSLCETGIKFHRLDITDKKALEKLISALEPAAVFSTAAMTNVDKCELERDVALRVNGKAVGQVAEACAKAGAYLCHISTDYVFDGAKGNYLETDPVHPTSVYGESKLLGERELEKHGKGLKWTILRSSILYGAYRKRFNFAMWLVDELRAGREVRIVTDQVGSPTLADDLADACLELWKKGATGLYHVAGREAISRYDFALKVCDVFGFEKTMVKPIMTSELKQKAKRPQNSSLDVGRVEGVLGRKMMDVREGLGIVREQEKALERGGKGPLTRTA